MDCLWADIGFFFRGGGGGEGKKGRDRGKKQEIEVRELFCFGIREYFFNRTFDSISFCLALFGNV